MSRYTKSELTEAARRIISESGMGRIGFTKRKANERRRRRRGAVNGVVAEDKAERDGCFVYVMESDAGPIKVGVAKDPHRRLAGVQTGSPHRVRLVYAVQVDSVEAARRVEREAHRRLAGRLNGEWFDCLAREAAEVVKALAA